MTTKTNKIKIFASALFIMAFLSSCKEAKNFNNFLGTKTPPAAELEKRNYKLYEVMKTDTVASIARKFKVDTVEIIRFNKVPKPYYLEPGMILKIPLPENNDSLTTEIDELIKEKNSNTTIVVAPFEFYSNNKTETTEQNESTSQGKTEENIKSEAIQVTSPESNDTGDKKDDIASEDEINSESENADNLPADLDSSESLDQDV